VVLKLRDLVLEFLFVAHIPAQDHFLLAELFVHLLHGPHLALSQLQLLEDSLDRSFLLGVLVPQFLDEGLVVRVLLEVPLAILFEFVIAFLKPLHLS
jgi:hypothetical protein